MAQDSCDECGGKVRQRRVTVDLRRKDHLYVFEHVPVGVCSRCGQRYYPGPLLEQLDEIAQYAVNGAKRVTVPTIDYAEVG